MGRETSTGEFSKEQMEAGHVLHRRQLVAGRGENLMTHNVGQRAPPIHLFQPLSKGEGGGGGGAERGKRERGRR